MSSLHSFRWEREPPLVDSVLDDDVSEDIWTALGSCIQLRDLDVTDARDDYYLRAIHESQVCIVKELLSGLDRENVRFFHFRTLLDSLIALGNTMG